MHSLPDRLIIEFDRGLRTLFAPSTARRSVPVPDVTVAAPIDADSRVESGRLMRVNHAGEVCAQALYQGQALFARSPQVLTVLRQAAEEERDHLAWCQHRLDQLGATTSVLNPVWYAGSFALGVLSGMAGDRWSMAFLVETEHQVEQHLQRHIEQISPADLESRAILAQMQADEARHGQAGESHGAAPMPEPIRHAMQWISKVMTRTSYWF